MKTELLIQMDGLNRSEEQVFVLAASNLPWDLDSALIRRLEKRIFVPLPDEPAREAIFKRHLPPNRARDLDYALLASKTQGYSGSDVVQVCKESAMRPVRRIIRLLETDESKAAGAYRKAEAMY